MMDVSQKSFFFQLGFQEAPGCIRHADFDVIQKKLLSFFSLSPIFFTDIASFIPGITL